MYVPIAGVLLGSPRLPDVWLWGSAGALPPWFPPRRSPAVHALDIDPEMVAITKLKAEAAGVGNVRTYVRDFVADGTGLPDASVQYVMLFNILHAECPDALLREAYRVLAPGGKLGIIHWNYDPTTPRGPAMTIRPRPEQCREWAESVGFSLLAPGIIDLPPYHYGMAMKRLEDDMGA